MSAQLDYKGRVNLKALKRRSDYLRKTIREAPADQRGVDYDIAELSALKFAIATIEEHFGVAS